MQVRVRDQTQNQTEHTLTMVVTRTRSDNPIRLLGLRYHEVTDSWDVTALAPGWLQDNCAHAAAVCLREIGDRLAIWERLRAAHDLPNVYPGANRFVADILNPPQAGGRSGA